MIEEITKYRTEDGREFDDKGEAFRHTCKLHFEKLVADKCSQRYSDDIVNFICNYKKEVLDFINKIS